MEIRSLDIFCDVIDNFGDIGFVYRFAREFLRHNRGVKIRVFLNDMQTFAKINHSIDISAVFQTTGSITYVNSKLITAESFAAEKISDLLIEAFGCQIPDFIMNRAYTESRLLINLEYLSAEDWVDGYHMKESLLPEGTLKKYFFMPGFTKNTGGVILNSFHPTEADLEKSKRREFITNLLSEYSIKFPSDNPDTLTGTVFTYNKNFENFFRDLNSSEDRHFNLLVFGGKSRDGIIHTLESLSAEIKDEPLIRFKNCTILFLPTLRQEHYDRLLYFTDFNIVRGEDSLVRAILAGKPFLWNAYIQKQKYQLVKVDALCGAMENYFDYQSDFTYYHKLMTSFNNVEFEDPALKSDEQFKYFFDNLKNFEHATQKMCYFLQHHCNLIKKISDFISNF